MIIGEGANTARTLGNRAANEMYPEVLADEARAIAERNGLWIDVIDEKRATELGMGMFMAVGRGSDNPPRMIVMRSGGEGERDKLDRHLAIVGKGVCFDSGGISIKPSDRMEEMKMDKAGACTVIAAIETVARLAPGTPLLAVAPAVENMPGPHSTRPGDIVTALNGKKVDITNTDAEGRLILGDAMTYAERLGATHLVDVATLTGAVARALGHLVTGAFGQPQALVRRGRRRGGVGPASATGNCRSSRTTSPTWRAGTPTSRTRARPRARSSRARLFLREFATVPWVHLDIAGTGYYRKAAAVRGARRDRRRRMPRSSSWRSPGPPDDRARSAVVLAIAARRRSASPPTASRRAGRSTTRSIRRDAGSTGGRSCAGSIGALAFGLLPLRFAGDTLALLAFGAWFVTLSSGWRRTSISGCSPTS